MSDPTPKQPRDPFHTHDCTACGAPCGTGKTNFGETIHFDLKARVWALVGDAPLIVVRTELAAVDHRDVCPYKDI